MIFRNRAYIIFIVFIVAAMASCSPLHKVPPDDALYTGATVKVGDSDLSKKKRKSLSGDLEDLTRPRPNKKFLGIRWKLFFYNIGLRNKMSEAPVLLSDVNVDHNVKVLQSSLENQGYFRASVQGDTVVKNRKGKAIYTVRAGHQYLINEIQFPDTAAILQKTVKESSEKTFLKTGEPFNLNVIKGERERIDAYVKERGFYYFDPDLIIVQVDSTIGNDKVNLYVKVKPNAPAEARDVYYINDIFIFTNYRLQTADADTLKSQAEFYKGYYVVDRRKLYKPKMFSQTMRFVPGDIYNRTDQSQSVSRLVNLNLFKFVKNRFEPAANVDSPKLNVYYYLTPFPKKSIRAEVNASTKSNNLTGSSLTLGWRNRNTFRGGELFSIEGTGGFEVQYSSRMRGYNTYRAGIEAKLDFPRFLIPFFPLNTTGSFVPKTNISLAYDILNKRKLYTMQSFRAGFGYVWKENIRKEHQLNPISITYVQPLQVTQEYKDSANKNKTLLKAIEKQFILGSSYNYNYNELEGRPAMSGGIYFNGNLDLSGNVAGLVTGANLQKGDTVKILGGQFSQYVKFEADSRFYFKISNKAVWANRIIAGLGLPYGNSTALPYIKQFFVGGTNSIRAFRSRSLGPGTYRDVSTTTFLPDQSGDIKLEFNSELRAQIAGLVHGAIFIDAGNIWLYNADPLKPGARFDSKTFLKEIAVGAGAGLRFDISFLVIRFDVAFPLRKPYLPDGERWVVNKINFGSAEWRKENIVYNLGIGYPF
ncbi:MAG: BamA/TamA family outer membrane protein [Chitinophagaceae bacterium]